MEHPKAAETQTVHQKERLKAAETQTAHQKGRPMVQMIPMVFATR